MEMESINGITGKASFSVDKAFLVVRQFPSSNLDHGKIVLADAKNKSPLFIYQLKRPDYFKVSNNGIVIGVNSELESFVNEVIAFNSSGKVILRKVSNCNALATAISNDGVYAAVGFGGNENHIESYSIIIFDLVKVAAVQVIPIPDNTSVFDMTFDPNNRLQVSTSS